MTASFSPSDTATVFDVFASAAASTNPRRGALHFVPASSGASRGIA